MANRARLGGRPGLRRPQASSCTRYHARCRRISGKPCDCGREGQRAILGVPLLREDEAIGVLGIRRLEARPFSPKQIDLLTTFADQAVIAIENVRLFDEVQQRNRELSEALEQQTATSTILRAIAASPTDVQPVLDAVAESAAKLCDAYDAAILLKDGESLAWKSHHGPIPIDFANWPIGRDWVTGRAFVDRKPVHVDDLAAAADEFPAGQAMAKRLGHRTILAMPLLREEEAIGALVIRRLEVRPFTQKQIELLTIFADQAVIAIENVRLFNEVEARTEDLGEALRQQTATADVLKVISRSVFDLDSVLQTLAGSAVELCRGFRAASSFRMAKPTASPRKLACRKNWLNMSARTRLCRSGERQLAGWG